MTDSTPKLSRARKKRTQEKTKKARKRKPLIGVKLALCYLTTLAGLLVILNLGRGAIFSEYTPGQLAPSTVIARVDFETVDLAATEVRREQADLQTPAVLKASSRGLTEAKRRLNTLFAKAEEMSPENPEAVPSPAAGFSEVTSLLGLQAELAALPTLFTPEECQTLKPLLERSLEQTWMTGLISETELNSDFEGLAMDRDVKLGANGILLSLKDLRTPASAAEQEATRIREEAGLTKAQAQLAETLLLDLFQPNLEYDRVATEELKKTNREEAPEVTVLRREGTTLMEARTPITHQVVEDLQRHQRRLLDLEAGSHNIAQRVGQGLYLAVGLAVSLALLFLLDDRKALGDLNRLGLWMILTMGSLLLGQGMIYLSANLNLIPGHFLPSLLPLALAPMLATILYGPKMGLAIGFSSSLALSLQHDLDLVIFFSGLAATVTSSLTVRAIHKRSNLFRAGLWIGGIHALILFGAGSLELVPAQITILHALTAFGGGLFTSLLVLLLISPFEYLLNVTTDIRLLELSDMGHPLLSRLAMEAPGTYHHSLMVAHLAQTAAREIRGNDLLVRVCAYYHDIGKLTKPEFFIENSSGRQNPHDELSPSMSRLLIISHVKEGVSLAKRYKLPKAIVDGIEQHHGTSLIQFFYHRARKQAEESSSNVEAEDYRYPGPKPRSREMGILMLADAIEAASRTIDKSKPGQIEGLVNELIEEKLLDGQLDHCALTFAEIHRIRRSFVFSLNNMLHGRVAYPGQEEQAEDAKQPSEKPEATAEKEEPAAEAPPLPEELPAHGG